MTINFSNYNFGLREKHFAISNRKNSSLSFAQNTSLKDSFRANSTNVRAITSKKIPKNKIKNLTFSSHIKELTETKKIFETTLEQLGLSTNISFKKMAKILRNLATTDQLTGLKNKAVYAATLKKFEKSGKKFSYAMIDFDHFKGVNDILGHDTGDIFLKRLGKIIKKTMKDSMCKKYDKNAFRYGGEEFVIILPSTSAEDAKKIIEKLAKKVEEDKILRTYFEKYLSNLKERKTSYIKRHKSVNLILKHIKEKNEFQQIKTEIITLFNENKHLIPDKDLPIYEDLIKNLSEWKKLPEKVNDGCSRTRFDILIRRHFDTRKETGDIDKWLNYAENKRKFTISAGISDNQGRNSEQTIKSADAACYKSKLTRGIVTVADPLLQ